MRLIFLIFGLLNICELLSIPKTIQFSIPEVKIVTEIPVKKRDFAEMVPGHSGYLYDSEEAYYQGYQEAFFAVTKKKGGWDCMRHYEILANGCIPYFIDLEQCDQNTMFLFPRELVKKAMSLPGVSYLKIDHELFDESRYYEILNELLEYTRKFLTTKNLAKYLLEQMNYCAGQKILFLSGDVATDYLRCLTLIGLKEILGQDVIDFPKIEHIYKNFEGDTRNMYGRGMTYTRIVEDVIIDRESSKVFNQIKNKEFDLIIYGSIHRGLPFHKLVKKYYSFMW